MQFVHRLLRANHEKAIEESTSTRTNRKEEEENKKVTDQNQKADRQKHIIVFKTESGDPRGKSGAGRGEGSGKKYWKVFLLCRKDVVRSCLYSTVNVKSPSDPISARAQQYWINSMKMKKDQDVAAKALVVSKIDHAGNKVLPISETTANGGEKDDSAASEKKEKSRGEKGKAMSRMKELLRWAAAAKSEKGARYIGRKVLQFRNRPSLKAVADDDEYSTDSPKISFRWDVESCSTTSSVYSAISVASLKNNPNLSMLSRSLATNFIHDSDGNNSARKGNWITTDSEFVVLEL